MSSSQASVGVGTVVALYFGMDLWIGVKDLGDVREVSLHGRLAAAGIHELERAARDLEPPVRIDISQLLSVDEAGVRALRARRQSGEELVGARPLIELLIDEGT
jgi:hypothetical protein